MRIRDINKLSIGFIQFFAYFLEGDIFIMSVLKGFVNSSIGMKYMMGIAGLVWTGFVFAHMAGNLLMFLGPDAYNSYGHALTSSNIIYVAEAILVLALSAHVGLAIRLRLKNRSARSVAYQVESKSAKAASPASKTMMIHGSLLLVFIIYHLITFKFGTYYETTVDGVVMRDLYRNLVEVFSKPQYVLGYVLCMFFLGVHLSHGFGSVFQSFGLNHPSYQKPLKCLSLVYAAVVALGFMAQPIYIFLK